MEAAIVTILIFLGVIAISAVLFTVWLVWEIVRLVCTAIWRLVAGPPPPQQAIVMKPANSITCPNPRCRSENPAAARFCRRCGSEVPRVQHALARRAAMW
jgi:ribosomal protein L40E